MECKDDDVHEAKQNTDTKNLKSRIMIPQNKNNDLKNKDACEVQYKDEDIGNDIKLLKDNSKDNNSIEESKIEDSHEVKCKDKDSDLETELKDDLTPKVKNKVKNKDTGKGIETLQNISDVKKVENKFIRQVGSDDEDVIEENCSDATYLARQITSAERLCQAESTVIISKRSSIC